MRSCDVLIVGGGPAGSSAAWQLRRGGADVLVLDQEAFPRLKLCAGWITPEVVRDLQMDVASYPHRFLTFECLHVHLKGMRLRVPSTTWKCTLTRSPGTKLGTRRSCARRTHCLPILPCVACSRVFCTCCISGARRRWRQRTRT